MEQIAITRASASQQLMGKAFFFLVYVQQVSLLG